VRRCLCFAVERTLGCGAQERFRSMAPIYYRGSQAAILVYDITNLDSFNDVRIWLEGRLAELHLSSS
jgi:hypothetical protein